ncbi:DUF58 domain-containing protein [Vagococcus hydrophili]|uniref:DUF58 domain-containing protein n=1 Tax=Vagococcus hydrophili TaxID=2714947 RepID=A0A6G8AUQ1_9ENTE|nr:DUF58 domain-containing protein [Vagococcus hydrophili]QIL48717.1 DUF58 domain-containing protein [Vagococcus hydrophili]
MMKNLNSWLIGVFFLLSFIYALTFNSQMSWRVVIFLGVMIFISFLSTRSSLNHLRIDKISPVLAEVGERRHVDFKLRNHQKNRFIYPILTIKCAELDYEERFFLFNSREKRVRFLWEIKERTALESLNFELVSSDLFGLVHKSKRLEVATEIYVLPQTIEKSYLINTKLKLVETNLFGERSFELENIREYQKGDAPREIDWKLSSKKQTLMLREYQKVQVPKTVYIFYGIKSFYFEKSLQYFYTLFKEDRLSDSNFYLLGEQVDQTKVTSPNDFAKIKKAADPGAFLIPEEKNIIIITPERTAKLNKALQVFSEKQQVCVIDFQEMEKELMGE